MIEVNSNKNANIDWNSSVTSKTSKLSIAFNNATNVGKDEVCNVIDVEDKVLSKNIEKYAKNNKAFQQEMCCLK